MNTISKDIDEDVLRSFIWAVHNFFTISTKKEPEIEVPFLYEGMYHLDYTGAIGVSGNHKGAIYLTLGEDIVDRLFTNHQKRYFSNQETSVEELKEQKLDYTGEIINIISGNVRNYLGENFLNSFSNYLGGDEVQLNS